MKLDPRIKSLSDVLTCFDIEEAKQFIGQKGYFTDYFNLFDYVATLKYGVLEKVSDSDCSFKCDCWWRFFIPESRLIKTKIKKWRPFTAEEFIKKFPLMSPVIIRNKPDGEILVRCVTGYSKTHPRVYFGRGYNLDVLFNNCEYQDARGNWLPFGIEE